MCLGLHPCLMSPPSRQPTRYSSSRRQTGKTSSDLYCRDRRNDPQVAACKDLPLEMVLTLNQQLIQDIDRAVENAGGRLKEQKSQAVGLILRLAPCQRENSSIVFEYF